MVPRDLLMDYPSASTLATRGVRSFERTYYAVAAATLAAAACLPWLVPLSYRVLGFDPRLAHMGTYAAFQAHLATHAFRRNVLAGVLVLALGLVAMSLAAIALRAQRRSTIRWLVLGLVLAGAVGAVVIMLSGLAAGAGICC